MSENYIDRSFQQIVLMMTIFIRVKIEVRRFNEK